jgi:hypothetical protein
MDRNRKGNHKRVKHSFKTVPFGGEHLQYILVVPVVVFLALKLRKRAEWLYNKKAW